MPIYIRLIIMIGEIIGLGIASFLFMKKNIKLAEVEHKLKVSFRYVITSFDTWFVIILNIINICIFVFSFYDLRFCSYHKLVLVSLFTIFAILFITNALYYEKHIIIFLIGITSLLAEVVLVSGFIASLIVPLTGQPNGFITLKTLINEETSKESIYPIKFVIGHSQEDDAYVFFYQDDTGYHFEDKYKAQVYPLADTEDSYLVRYTSTKTFLNEEIRLYHRRKRNLVCFIYKRETIDRVNRLAKRAGEILPILYVKNARLC